MRWTSRFVILCVVLLIAACVVARPTQVTTTWKDPDAGRVRFRKAAVVFVSKDSSLRRQIEDRYASRLPNATPSHSFLSDAQLAAADTQAIRAALLSAGSDGVVMLRLLSVETRSGGETSSADTAPTGDLWEYLRRTPRSALAPGSGAVITMESRVYAINDARLLWAGHSQSFNPLSIKELVNMIVDSSAEELRKQGLL